jgi:hypothetical protein
MGQPPREVPVRAPTRGSSFPVAALLLLGPAIVGAQPRGAGRDFRFGPPSATLTVHGGLAIPTAGSDLWTQTTQEFTVSRSDFTAGSIGIDLAFALAERTDFVLGFTRDESYANSEFRDYVDGDGFPIQQFTRFKRLPFTASVRYNLASRGRTIGSYAWIPNRVVPFVGAGVGMMRYEFEQAGDFIDMGTMEVFYDRFVEKGWSPLVQGSAGATVNLNPYLQFVGEVRYVRARGRPSGSGDDFQGFERLDLSGMSTVFGIALRF